MTIREQLLEENSKKRWNIVAAYIGKDRRRIANLMGLFFSDEYRVVQRASQVVSMICDRQPDMMEPWLEKMVDHLHENSIDAVRRNVLRTFQKSVIPEVSEGRLFDLSLGYMKSIDSPIAVKVFSMTVARRICEKYPELAVEVIPLIENLVRENYSTGTVNRGQKELNKLNKLFARTNGSR